MGIGCVVWHVFVSVIAFGEVEARRERERGRSEGKTPERLVREKGERNIIRCDVGETHN